MSRSFTSVLRHLAAGLVVAGLQIMTLTTAYPASALSIMDGYKAEAKTEAESFRGFSAVRGSAFFSARHRGGKPETPSCTGCHSANPMGRGQTRAGKDIAPMAVSKSPDRYQVLKKVEKWFRRNCNSVIGRLCTAREKGDFLTFMMSQ